MQRIGAYEITETLGRGGMGVVYRARDGRTGQAVALKTVKLAAEGLLSGIRREVHALARLRHPGIVRILEHGVEEGMPWYAMELLDGKPLGEWTGAQDSSAQWWTQTLTHGPAREVGFAHTHQRAVGPLDSQELGLGRREGRECLSLALRLCSTLGYLHGEGLVHRDLKPDNILVRPDGTPVLVDFGLASHFGGELSREVLSVEATSSGTAAYMAPEQIRGELLDARADLYALGCILFELFTGQRVFSGLGHYQLMAAHLFQPPPLPSSLNPAISPELDELLLRLLEKEPGKRLGYAGDVAERLQRLGAQPGPEQAWPAPRPYLYRPGFSGREALLARLRSLAEPLREEPDEPDSDRPRGAFLLLAGESGAGKTRLLMELGRAEAAEGTLGLAGECSQDSGEPLQPLRKPLQAIADHCRSKGFEESERVFGPRGPVLANYEPAIASLPGQSRYPALAELPPKDAALRLHHALAETLATLVSSPLPLGEGPGVRGEGTRGLLLILDDLQWADELTLGFLEHWTRGDEPRRLPILLLGAYRSEEATPALQKLARAEGVILERLASLEPSAVGSMVRDMLALPASPKSFADFLQKNSEGNPFFVAEYLRTAVAERLLWRDEHGAWQIGEPGSEAATRDTYERLPLPRSIRDLVGRRLAELPASALRLLEALATLGREESPELCGMVSGLSEDERLEAASELLRRQVLESTASGSLRFLHDKLREVGYERIEPERRPALHRAAAAAIVGACLDTPRQEQVQGVLGHHWERAGEPALARPCYLAAARLAVHGYAHEEAERLYRAFLRLVDAPTPDSVAARNELGGRVLFPKGRNEELLAEHQRAEAEARGLGDAAGEAESLRLRGAALHAVGRVEEARACYEASLELARSSNQASAEAGVLENFGKLHLEQGRLEEAKSVLLRALELQRQAGHRAAEGSLLGSLANVFDEQAANEQATSLYEQALELHRQVGNRQAEGSILSRIANQYILLGQAERALELYERTLVIFRETGDRRKEGQLLSNLGMLYTGRDNERALKLLEQALAINREVGERRFEASTLNYLGGLFYEQGKLQPAREHFERALGIFRGLGDRIREGIVLNNLGKTHLELGALDLAFQSQELALAIFRELGDRIKEGIIQMDLGYMHLNQGRLELARTWFLQAVEIFRAAGARLYVANVFRGLIDVEMLIGSLEQTQAWTREAEAILEEAGEKAELGFVLCLKGRLELCLGQDARPVLERAEALAREVGAEPESNLHRFLDALRRAILASEAGQRRRLFRGRLIEDLPEKIHQSLAQAGVLDPAATLSESS